MSATEERAAVVRFLRAHADGFEHAASSALGNRRETFLDLARELRMKASQIENGDHHK